MATIHGLAAFARSGLGDVNYVLRKVEPALTALTLGAALR